MILYQIYQLCKRLVGRLPWINQFPDEFVRLRSTYTEQKRPFLAVVRNLVRRETLFESFGIPNNPAVVLVVFLDLSDQYHASLDEPRRQCNILGQ